MLTYFTTSTGPAIPLIFTDPSGNALNVTGATFTVTFRSVATRQKVRGGGSVTITNASTGQISYALSSTDMSTAYALASALIGDALFEVLAEATISAVIYDSLPTVIGIRKV